MFLCASRHAGARLKEVEAAAQAAAVTMQKEVAADSAPPPRVDPKIAVLNLLQASCHVESRKDEHTDFGLCRAHRPASL